MRLGMLCPNKRNAVVNVFGNTEETCSLMEGLGAIDMKKYYDRHHKAQARYRLRKKILKEKKEKKIAHLAAAKGIDAKEIDPESVEVSDVSEGELGRGFSGASQAEDLVEMFETELEEKQPRFVNLASPDLNLNDYVQPTEMKYNEDVPLSDKPYYEFYENAVEFPIDFIEEPKLDFPDILKVYSFPRGVLSEFPEPGATGSLRIMDYYLIDGAALIPILALGVQPRDSVADFCAAPGGKSLTILQTLRPSTLLCNDKNLAQFAKLKQVFAHYIPEMKSLTGLLRLTHQDASKLTSPESYDKILIDAPCTMDRVSINDNEETLFTAVRHKERIGLPHVQKDILLAGLRSLRPKGSLVYTTMSLSPIQNDGVIHAALSEIYEERKKQDFVICDLKETLRPLRGLYRMYSKFKYGQQIIPFLPGNYGPAYLCKITRN